jgi:glutamine synthetase
MGAFLTLDELRKDVAEGTLDTVLVAFPDMQGRLVGKRFHAEFFLESAHAETHACNYLLANDIEMELVPGYASAGWEKGYGDFVLKSDLPTLRRVPWLAGTALVLSDVLDHHGHPLAIAPRTILKAQVERLAKLGLMAFTASELEFYLFEEDYRTLYQRRYRDPTTSGYYIEDYHLFQTSKEEDVMRAMRNQLRAAGIQVENSKGEWGPGQEELNVRYADPLLMADNHVVMKNGMKEIAHAKNKSITFMAKWSEQVAGSSCHVHMSLWDPKGKTARSFDSEAEYGLSPLMRHFMAGQIAHAAEYTYFLAPTINSYKRFRSGTFAPTKIVWSRDNRTAGFRLVGEGSTAIRCECRIPGADANPYLAFAALIAAGISGIEQKLPLSKPYQGDSYGDQKLSSIPTTLRDAVASFRKSEMLRAAFGEEVIAHYAHAGDWEQAEYDRRITDWELMRGFERY